MKLASFPEIAETRTAKVKEKLLKYWNIQNCINYVFLGKYYIKKRRNNLNKAAIGCLYEVIYDFQI